MTDGKPLGDDLADDVAREENVKHLEMIQAIIGRLASNSFVIKAWTIPLAAGSYGIAVNRLDWRVSVTGIFVVAAFWALDAYYLRQERLFRLLYDYVRSETRSTPRFSMHTTRFDDRVSYRGAVLSFTLAVLYGILIAAGVALSLLSYFSPRP
jgi:hypothetical protein